MQPLRRTKSVTQSDTIVWKESFEVLDVLLNLLLGAPNLEIPIEGNTNNVDSRDYKVNLSRPRPRR
jgi:outer membrane protein OmpA-like peptidoglycan-associated protein